MKKKPLTHVKGYYKQQSMPRPKGSTSHFLISFFVLTLLELLILKIKV